MQAPGTALPISVVQSGQGGAPVVAIDVDLTLVDHRGEPIHGAREATRYLKATGWKIIVWTARHDLAETKALLERNGIVYDHLNENPETDAGQHSRKIHFDATVDDKAVPFGGDWFGAVAELDRRRAMWQTAGHAKSRIRLMAIGPGMEPEAVAEMALVGGVAVDVSGGQSAIARDLMENGVDAGDRVVRAEDGEDFFRALAEIQGAYLWSDAVAGR